MVEGGKMSECYICKEDIITYSSSRFDQTGIELSSEKHDGKIIKLCWKCYDNLIADNKE